VESKTIEEMSYFLNKQNISLLFEETLSKLGLTQAIGLSVLFISVIYLFFFPRKTKVAKKESVVVITGCDSGFGYLTSLKLVDLGYIVVSAFLNKDSIPKLQGKVALTIVCDVTNKKDIENLAKTLEGYLRTNKYKLWAIVNNAGIAPFGSLDWMDMEYFRKAMDVNYFGSIAVLKSLLPFLKVVKYSRVINISSVAGVIGAPGFGPYSGIIVTMMTTNTCRYEVMNM